MKSAASGAAKLGVAILRDTWPVKADSAGHALRPPHPPFGHLSPEGEGSEWQRAPLP